MKNIFENAYFGKPYKTRDGRKALFSRKDGDIFDLETEDSYNPVRLDGSFLYTKEGYESSGDIVSEWQESISEEELEDIAIDEGHELSRKYGYDNNLEHENIFIDGVKEGYRIAIEKYGSK